MTRWLSRRDFLKLSGLALLGAACDPLSQTLPKGTPPLPDNLTSLRPVGTSINPVVLKNITWRNKALADGFQIFIPENDCKWGVIHPAANHWEWSGLDEEVAWVQRYAPLGSAHQGRIMGISVIWGSLDFIPEYVKGLSGTELLNEMRAHIGEIVRRYSSSIQEWNIVNEGWDAGGMAKTNFFYENINAVLPGVDYVTEGLLAAWQAKPDIQLWFNEILNPSVDGYPGQPNRLDTLLPYMQELKKDGLPIVGIGYQGHHDVFYNPTYQQIMDMFDRIQAAGFRARVTEYDDAVRLEACRPATNEELEQQGKDYAAMARAVFQHPAADAFCVWGFWDKQSWRQCDPAAKIKRDHADMYADDWSRKPAWYGAREGLQGA